jgi:hypothetical protein
MKPAAAALFSALAILVVLAGCKSSRKGYESAPYQVVSRDGKFEIRGYPALTVVETPMADDSGSSFQRLFRYISGGNADGEKIPMTTPVFMAGGESQRSMSFVMPADRKSSPVPNDVAVSVATIPAGRFAVFGFPGSRSAPSEAKALARLREWMEARKLATSAQPVFGYFDPPWTPPFLRRNEVMLRVNASPGHLR